MATSPPASRRKWPPRRTIIAVAVALMGVLNIASAFFPHGGVRAVWLEEAIPLEARHASRTATLIIGFLLIYFARGLQRGKHQAWQITVALLAISVVAHNMKHLHIEESVATTVVLFLLLAWSRKDFVARSDPPSVRLAYVALVGIILFIPLYGIVGFALLARHFTPAFSVHNAFLETTRRVVFASADVVHPRSPHARWFLDSIGWMTVASVLGVLYLFLRPVLQAPALHPIQHRRAWDILRRWGVGPTSYMTFWHGNSIFFSDDGRSYIAYRLVSGVALVLGDPIGPPDDIALLTRQFLEFCRQQDWEPAFYSVTARHVELYRSLGFDLLKVAEDTMVDLERLEFKGKSWQDVRTAINRAAREGITFQWYLPGRIPENVLAGIRSVSQEWLQGKMLPEMGFTLGRVSEISGEDVRTAVAIGASGQVLAFVTWLPMYEAKGWVIDLMRRSAEAPAGTMEFVIASSAEKMRGEGFRMLSLGAAPLASVGGGEDESVLQRGLNFAFEHVDGFYHFKSLFRFKEKFHPRWEPVYLAYHGPTSLPQVTFAIMRAYMPKIGLQEGSKVLGLALDRLPWPKRPWNRLGRAWRHEKREVPTL